MGGLKKSKSGGKGRGKAKEGRKETKKLSQDEHQRDVLLPLQERVQAVRPFWETLLQEDRVKTLTVSINDLKQRAAELAEQQRKQAAADEQMYPGEMIAIDLEPSIEELLKTGITRLTEKPTWKLWQWLPDQKEFLDADSFRNYIENEHIEEGLRALLPKDEGKPVEKPPEAALRTRMSELLQRVHQHNRQMQEEPMNGRRARAPRATPDQIGAAMRETNIELINIMMEALEQEHEFLYQAVLLPITTSICELLDENQRESNCLDLCYEDLEKLHPDEVARICEWLTEKVDGFSSKIKPEAKDVEEEEEEEEGIGDVDLFTLSEDQQTLSVHAKWLQHLQERVLGDDGQPRKMKDGEDPFNMGLVLEWVYGTIVSTAEKARDGAKRTLGAKPPTATQAHEQLVAALREQQTWEQRAKDAKELLNRMLKSRKDAADLTQHYDTRPAPLRPGSGADTANEQSELPDHVIIAMLNREVLLTEAKLHALEYELVTSERKLRQLRSQLRQGEPEFERLKRELEEVKNQPRGLEGTFRSAAEMERHRAQMADAAIEEQLEVQTAFREHGARLQAIYDKRQRTEMEMARREQEIKQLKGWKQTVQSLIDRFEEMTAVPAPLNGAIEASETAEEAKEEQAATDAATSHHQALEAATRSLTGHDQALTKLRNHFQKDVRRQLYSDEDDRTFFDWIRQELRGVEKKLEDGRAVLHHLEMFLVNVACNDPGAAIGATLVLPLLQERLDAKALDFAAQQAAAAEEAIIKMEEEKAERAKQEREKRQKMKQKAKDKVRIEKERATAERDAKLEAERALLEESKQALLKKEEELKKQQLEEMERRRQAEEEQMEARRRELLSDLTEEGGYWRRRMAQEAQTQALQEESIVKAGPQAEDGPVDSSASDQSIWKDDNDGFRDTAKGPRRARFARRKPEADVDEKPANGYNRANNRLEDGKFSRQSRDLDGPRENGFALRDRRPSIQDGRTLPIRELKPSHSSSTVSEKSRSGRTSPLLNEQPKPRSAESQAPLTLPLRPRAVPAETAQQPGERPKLHTAPKDKPAASDQSTPAERQEVAMPPPPEAFMETADPSKAEDKAETEAKASAKLPEPQQPASVSEEPSVVSEHVEPPKVVTKALPRPDAAPAQEQQPDSSLPGSTASSTGHEFAPGTPAQQPPPVPPLVPTPSVADGMPHQTGGGAVFFMQNMTAQQPLRNPGTRMMPHGQQMGVAGPPPPPDAGYGRPHSVRREGAGHYMGPQNMGPMSQGMQNGPIPMQPRRPQIAPPRGLESGMAPPNFRSYPRGQQPPPPGPVATVVQFPGQPVLGTVPQPVGSHAADSLEPAGPGIVGGGAPFGMQPHTMPHPSGLGTYSAGQGHPNHGKMPGSQPIPQMCFAGPLASPPYGMGPMVNSPSGPPSGAMQHAGGSPPQAGPKFPFAGGSPRGVMHPIRTSYSRGSSPQQSAPAFRPKANTTLRATAPDFVPGVFRPPAEQQAQLPRRPLSDQRPRSEERNMFRGAGLQLPASSDLSHAHSGTLSRHDSDAAQAPQHQSCEAVPSLPAPATPESLPEPYDGAAEQQADAVTPLGPEPSGSGSMTEQAEATPELASTSQALSHAGQTPPAVQNPPLQEPSQQMQTGNLASLSSAQGQPPQHILTRPRSMPMPQVQDTGKAPSEPSTSQSAAAPGPAPVHQAPAPLVQQPKWSSVAALDRQATHSQAGTSNGPMRKAGSHEALRGSSPTAREDAAKRPSQAMSGPGSSNNIRKSGSANQLSSNRSSTTSLKTAGDKRKITRAGGVTWEGLQDEFHRLKLVRGLSNEAGRNNCFLNVIIQSLWHLRSFREALLAMQPQTFEARGNPAEDVRVLRALWNIFSAFSQPREELADSTECGSLSQMSTSGYGEEAEAKRAKKEGQEDAAAAKVTNGWTVSPAELREAISSVSHAALRFDLTDMHDAAEVLDKIFSSLHRAQVGQPAEGELDAALPQRVRVPAPGVTAAVHQNGSAHPKRGPTSLVENLFGLDVQVPSPPDDEEETLAVKRSKSTGGAVVGRWQETTARSGRHQGSSPKEATKPVAKKPKDPSVVEMLQYIKLYHLVPAQGLKIAYDHLIGSSFEEVLKEADVAEVLAQNASNGTQSSTSRVAKTSDIVLLKRPRVFNLAIGWESAQAPVDVINATIDALSPRVDPAGVFKSAPKGPGYQLRCIVCYFGHHYKAYALSEELNEWLLLDDTTISHIGSWKDVKVSLRGSRLQPNLLFYEQQQA